MNIHVRGLTPTQLAISERRAKFRKSIAEKAEELARPKIVIEPEPEALPEEIPACAPICEPNPHYPSIRNIQIATGAYYGISRMDIISARRMHEVVKPRQVAMYLAKTLTPHSLPYIGRHFGQRDHTTVLHAVRKMRRLIYQDADNKEDRDCDDIKRRRERALAVWRRARR